MKKRLSLLLAAVFMLSSLSAVAGCAKKESGNILIGGLAPLTGDIAVYGNAVKNAASMAFDEINAAGGVLGKQIEYKVLDEKGDSAEAINAYNRLTSENIVALLGDVTSKPSIAVAELAAEDGLPMLTPTASHPDVTKPGDNIFRVCFLDPFQGAAMATFAADSLGAKTVAVLYNTSDDYSQGLAASFQAQAESLGLTVVNYEGYGADDKDFKAQLTKIASSNPDALFIPDYYAKDALIATQAREAGITVPILGADGWDGVLTAVDASNISVLNDVYFSNHYSVQDTSEKVSTFVKNYTAKFGEAPNALAALGYDAAYMLAQAITTADSTDSDKIVAALAGIKYEGVTGTIQYAGSGDPVKSVTIIRIVDGEYNFFDKVTPE